jgi:hypothetical protein
MQNLTQQQFDALKRIPTNPDGAPLDGETLQELVGMGLVEQRAGAVALTQRGAVVKVLRRAEHPN